jgi:hypothetical protein
MLWCVQVNESHYAELRGNMPEPIAPSAQTMNAAPAADAAQNVAPAANTTPQPPTQEVQAALMELQELTQDPAKLQARAEQLGLGDDHKAMNEKLKVMQTEAQAMMQQEQKLQKDWQSISEKAKSSTTKTIILGVVAALAGAGGVYAGIKSKDWGAFKKTAASVGGFVGAGAIAGFIGKAIFGGDLEEQAKQLMQQTQQMEVAKERMSSQAEALQKPFVEKMTAKMVEEAKKKSSAPAQAPAPGSPAATTESLTALSNAVQGADSADVAPSNSSIELKASNQSVTPPTSNQSIASPAASAMGVAPRAASFADQARADQAKAAAAGVGTPG